MQNKKSNRLWKTGTCTLKRLREKIKKAKTESKGIEKIEILNFLKCSPSFIGCYAENEMHSLTLQSFPVYLIVNIDKSNMPGSHWIALGIFKDKIEIFDTLGFQIFNWSRIPCFLLQFLHKFSQTRDIIILKRIQSDNSSLCGYYCILYVTSREFHSFEQLQSLFSSNYPDNDSVLIKFFK